MMKNYLAVHAHFYQPHTQDIWLGDYIEDSWHRKIKLLSKACYGANSASRVLAGDGRIEKVINNFSHLSFSFDPQLLEALRADAPNVYERILEADRTSMEKTKGFGNALAQPYHHTILPLASPVEKKLQIRWGLSSFEAHFGRKAQGMWLPEMAVNFETLDYLIEEKIQFILLNPWQGNAISQIGSGEFLGLFDQGVPSNRPFRIDRPKGSLNVFFYNPELTDGIYFGHWLRNADSLYHKITSMAQGLDDGQILSSVTHGDIFGNREAFGDMCLAALKLKIDNNPNLEWVNFATYLAHNPPKEMVKLSRGLEEKGTSWSCPHGVSRWEKSCGCHCHGERHPDTSWKAPLYKTFRKIWSLVIDSFHLHLGSLEEYLEHLETYGKLRMEKASPKTFLNQCFSEIADPWEQSRILSHFEALFMGQEMFTSGGWFVDNLQAPGALHILMCANRTLDLLLPYHKEDLHQEFEGNLAKIKAPQGFADARDLYTRHMEKNIQGSGLPAAIFLLDEVLPVKHKSSIIGPYQRTDFSKKKNSLSSQIITYTGQVKVQDRYTLHQYEYDYVLTEDLVEGIDLKLKSNKDKEFYSIDLEQLPEMERAEIASIYTGELESSMVAHGQKMFPELKKAIAYAGMLGVEPPPLITNIVRIGMTKTVQGLKPRKDGRLSEDYLEELDSLLSFAKENNLGLPGDKIRDCFTGWVAEVLHNREAFLRPDVVLYLDQLLKISRAAFIEPDITVAQTMVFDILQKDLKEILDGVSQNSPLHLDQLKSLSKLGEIFAIDLDYLKDKALEISS